MATMYPLRVDEATASDAEKRLFGKMHEELGGGWAVLHSLGLAGHPRKPWAEIDFVVVGPPGVFCMEVKGGRISRKEGEWIFTDRHDRTTVKQEGPFGQVGSASAALRRYVTSNLPRAKTWVFGYAVLTPDVVFEVEGPDIEKEILYDVRDASRPFQEFIDRLVEYWHQRIADQVARAPTLLNWPDVSAVVDLLRRDFDLRPTLRTRIGLVKDEMLRLTGEQFRVLDSLVDNARSFVKGGAGSGKTLLAVEEALRLSAAGRSVLFCCFNKQLARFLRKTFENTNVSIYHLHGLMADLVAKAELGARLPDADESDLFTVFYPELALEAVLERNALGPFDVLILDETQDLLLDPYLDLLDSLLEGGLAAGSWRAFLDPKQNIFSATNPMALERLLSLGPAQFRLQVNCRNTMPIATNTSLLSGIEADEVCFIDGPDVEQFWYDSEQHQRRMLGRFLNRILSEGVVPRDIVVLSTNRLGQSCVNERIRDVPYEVGDLAKAELDDRTIGFSTVQAFKGLESDVIVFVDINDLGSPHAASNMYVGASRARAMLAFFISETARPDYEALALDYGRRMTARRS